MTDGRPEPIFLQSLSLGRPPSISLAHVDIKPPTCVGPGLYVPREEIVCKYFNHFCDTFQSLVANINVRSLDHEWKNAFFIECLSPMLEAMVAVKQHEYTRITDLDSSVRNFAVPSLLDDHQPQDVKPRFLVMQRGLVAISRQIGKGPSPHMCSRVLLIYFFRSSPPASSPILY